MYYYIIHGIVYCYPPPLLCFPRTLPVEPFLAIGRYQLPELFLATGDRVTPPVFLPRTYIMSAITPATVAGGGKEPTLATSPSAGSDDSGGNGGSSGGGNPEIGSSGSGGLFQKSGSGGLFRPRSDSVLARRDSGWVDGDGPISKYTVAAKVPAGDGNKTLDKTPAPSQQMMRPKGVTRGGTVTRLLNSMGGIKRPRFRRRALEQTNSQVIRTLSKFSSAEKSLARKHSHHTLDAYERHELHVMELKAFKQADEERRLDHALMPWQISVLHLLDSHMWEMSMIMLTVFALYGSDMNDCFGDSTSDPTMDLLIGIAMAVFLVELVLLSAVRRGYFLSLNFVLELVAALSMLFDLKSLNATELLTGSGTAARAGRAARAGTRAGRLTRLMRILRLTRLFSLFLACKRVQDSSVTRSHRQTDVEIFGTEAEKRDFERLRGNHRSNSSNSVSSGSSNVTHVRGGDMEWGTREAVRRRGMALAQEAEEQTVSPDDEAGSLSRRSYQRTAIDVILAMLVMLICTTLLQYEPECMSPEYEGLRLLDSVASNASSGPAVAAVRGQLTENYVDDFSDSCLYLKIRDVVIIPLDPDTTNALRHPHELFFVDVIGSGSGNINSSSKVTSEAIFNRRPEFQAEAAASISVTTAVICIILAAIVKIKHNSDALTVSVNNPLLKLCDDMVMVSDMHLDGPIIHLPSQVNEIRNAQLAFLKMKHALAAFGKYVPYQVVREMIARGEGALLGVESKEITIFFSDIAGFTSICEVLEPADLLLLMSEYFDAMQKLIGAEESNGTLLEFIGDALLVVWNAPQDGKTHTAVQVLFAFMQAVPYSHHAHTLTPAPTLDHRADYGTSRIPRIQLHRAEHQNERVLAKNAGHLEVPGGACDWDPRRCAHCQGVRGQYWEPPADEVRGTRRRRQLSIAAGGAKQALRLKDFAQRLDLQAA